MVKEYMKRTFLYFGVGIFAFLIGLGLVFLFTIRPSYNLKTSKNVCQKCLDISNNELLETKTFSETIDNKDFYDKKIRLKARFGHDAGYTFLYESEENRNPIPVWFDKDKIPCVDTEKKLKVCTGSETGYSGSVDVTLIGYFEEINKQDSKVQHNKRFKVICVEQVNATDEEVLSGKSNFEDILFNLENLFITR